MFQWHKTLPPPFLFVLHLSLLEPISQHGFDMAQCYVHWGSEHFLLSHKQQSSFSYHFLFHFTLFLHTGKSKAADDCFTLPWKTFPLISTSYDSITSWIAAPTSQSRASIPASWDEVTHHYWCPICASYNRRNNFRQPNILAHLTGEIQISQEKLYSSGYRLERRLHTIIV
jgi:hypothetical protein